MKTLRLSNAWAGKPEIEKIISKENYEKFEMQ